MAFFCPSNPSTGLTRSSIKFGVSYLSMLGSNEPSVVLRCTIFYSNFLHSFFVIIRIEIFTKTFPSFTMMMPQTNLKKKILVFIFAYYHFVLLCCRMECGLDTADNEKHKVIFLLKPEQPPISTFHFQIFRLEKNEIKK